MSRQGILFIISGPSGVGKGTLRDNLMQTGIDVLYSISATTRKPRPGEIDGRDYFFVSRAQFQLMIENHELLEYAMVYQNYYGTPKRFVFDNLAQGHDIILEIDIEGARQVKDQFPGGVFIFILPPSREELGQRLARRGKDSAEAIQHRLACYDDEIKSIKGYDYVVVNESIPDAVECLKAIVIAERCRLIRHNSGGDSTWFHRP